MAIKPAFRRYLQQSLESPSFPSGLSRYIFCIHDARGRIEHVSYPKDAIYKAVARELKDCGNLNTFFDINDKRLVRKPQASTSFLQKRPFKTFPEQDEFVTTLPLTSMTSTYIENNVFVGRISFNDFIPNVIARNINSLIYIDGRQDRLVGFNYSFYSLFAGSFPNPPHMLDQPLSNFFSPTPLEFQKASMPYLDISVLEGFSLVYKKDFTRQDLNHLEEMPFPCGFTKQKAGRQWTAGQGSMTLLTVLREINTLKQDFVVSCTLRNKEGSGPYFILGERLYSNDRGLDDNGYLIGRTDRSDNVILKKVGFNSYVKPGPGFGTEEVTLHFAKKGKALFLFQDRECLIAFYDQDFLWNERSFITLGLRAGYRCILSCLKISVAPAGQQVMHKSAAPFIVEIKNRSRQYFALNRFFNPVTSSEQFMHINGYFLTDVTHMQHQITSLDSRVKTQQKRARKLKALLDDRQSRGQEMIGSGPAMLHIKSTVNTVAPSNATILIEGPTGSGKEVLARAIHSASSRREGPLVHVDCSTVPAELMESQLFGHEKGAFTGAVSQHIGFFEKADKSTLFLDEVSNLTMDTQVKLLQFLNNFTITRVGSTAPIMLDIRCITASNVSLEKMVRMGKFREDLYYRINVIYLKVPPLKDRREDIPELCAFFLDHFNLINNKNIKGLSPGVMEKMQAYHWPGNIRELKNAIQRAVIFCESDIIPEALIQFYGEGKSAVSAADAERSFFYRSINEKEAIIEIIRKYRGRVTEIARELGISRGTLYKFVKQEHIDLKNYRRKT
jgi:DNA-binding NtrC family response regulator